MKKLFVLLFCIYSTISWAQTNINLSNFTYWDTEPTIAMDPGNSNNIIAAWMKVTAPGILSIATSYSTDAGAVWSSPSAIPHLHPNFTSADPAIAFNNSGIAYLSYIDHSSVFDSGYVMVAKSINGGSSWGSGVKVISALETPDIPVDRPWIAVDNSSGAFSGRLYVVTKSIAEGALPHHIWMKSSSDNGATWSARILMDDSIPTNLVTTAMGVPTVGADGSLYIAYVSYNPSQSIYARAVCLKSTDGGNSFLPHIIANSASNSVITDTLYQGSYVLNANPANNGNLIYTFTDQRNGDPDILSFYSNDGAITWSSIPSRVNDDAISNAVGQDMCWAAFSQTGKYAVTWRDRRNTGGTSSSAFDVYTTISMDGGILFEPNYKISSSSSPFINIQKGNDFLGVCLDDNNVYNDWCDLRTGNTEIFVNKAPVSLFTDVTENSKNDELKLKIFPNPTASYSLVVFHLKQKQFLQIMLCDIQGKVVKKITSQLFSEGEHSLQINTSDISEGSYLVKIQGDNTIIISSVLLKVER